MTASVRLLAVDLGAESGRVVAGDFDGGSLQCHEIHRFRNQPVETAGVLQWDVLGLYANTLDGIRKAGRVSSIGIDSWGVDFGLLDRRGRLLGNPVHYRDARTRHMVEEACRRVPREEIYERTGVQFLPINTLYHLLALSSTADPQLEIAARLLTIPALFAYWLTGVAADEFTDATTTQCFDPLANAWAYGLLEALSIPTRIFGDVVSPGTVVGTANAGPGLAGVPVVAPGSHDTASAVAAVPLATDGAAAYISSGTWSLVGIEVHEPVITAAALDANLSNEGGVAGTFRLLKNVMGQWLLQESGRAWSDAGKELSRDELQHAAASAKGFAAVIDPDDSRLLRPVDMPSQIVELAAESGQHLTPEPATIARCVLDSLALKYRWTIEQLERVTGRELRTVHIVGGGVRNRLLCQLTADVCQRPVHAGPVEATAIGNLLVQAIAHGLVGSLAEGRELVRRSAPPELFEPRTPSLWQEAWGRLAYTRATAGTRQPGV